MDEDVESAQAMIDAIKKDLKITGSPFGMDYIWIAILHNQKSIHKLRKEIKELRKEFALCNKG